MKTLGLIGGMSWESTAFYYRHLNEITRVRLGQLHSAQLIMYSLDFAQIAAHQVVGDWERTAILMIDVARKLEKAGADGLIMCTSTMHGNADDVQKAISIPLIHIADATANAIVRGRSSRPVLLATRFVMEQDFYKRRLCERYGIDVVVPSKTVRDMICRVICDELRFGIVKRSSKEAFHDEIRKAIANGADSVILGCAEIAMLITQTDCWFPVYDAAQIHAEAAVEFALT